MRLNMTLIIAEEERKKREAEKTVQVPLYLPVPEPPREERPEPAKKTTEVSYYL